MSNDPIDARTFLFGLGAGLLAGFGLNALVKKCSCSAKFAPQTAIPPTPGTCYLAPGDSIDSAQNGTNDYQQILLTSNQYVYSQPNKSDKDPKSKIYLGNGDWAVLCPLLNGQSSFGVQFVQSGTECYLDLGDCAGKVWIVEDAFLRILRVPVTPKIRIKTKGGTAAASGTLFYVRRREDSTGNPMDNATVVVINGAVELRTATSTTTLNQEQYAQMFDSGRVTTPTSLP